MKRPDSAQPELHLQCDPSLVALFAGEDRPLSVCTRSTANGSLAMTSSMNAIAVFWVAARVGAQHPKPGTVVNRGELVVLLPAACPP